MPQLDTIVQQILLEGDVEVVRKLDDIAEKGADAFEQLSRMAEQGSSGLEVMAQGVGLLAAAFTGAAFAIGAYVTGNDDAIQKTNLLAKALGTSTTQLAGLEAGFAQAGVSTQVFEQFAQRLTTTVAREWPAIAESIRTSSIEQEEAQDRVVAATLHVQDAQRNLANVNADTSSKIANANLRVEEAYTRLQFSAQHALQTIAHDTNDVTSANQSLEAAQQRLATLQGHPPSDAEKQALQLKEAQLAVDKARQAQTDANLKRQQDQAEASKKAAAEEQAATDAQQKRELTMQESINARAKAELQVKEAINQKAQADEHEAQTALKRIPVIAEAINGVIKGGTIAAQKIDLADVSVTNLTKGIIAAAAAGKEKPTGLETMTKLMEFLSSEQGKLLDSSQRLAIVQQLSQRGFHTTGVAAFELLNALERGPAYYKKFDDAAKASFSTTDQAAENVQKFKDALAFLGFQIDLVNRSFAASSAPVFTAALDAIGKSLTDKTGLLHAFVDGLKAIGNGIDYLITEFGKIFDSIDKAFDLQKGRSFQIFLASAAVLVGAFAQAWLGIPVVIGAVVVAIGYVVDHLKELKQWAQDNRAAFIAIGVVVAGLVAFFFPWLTAIGLIVAAVILLYENWDTVKEKVGDVWKAIKDSAVGKFIETVIDKVKALYDWIIKLKNAWPKWLGGNGGETKLEPGKTGFTGSNDGPALTIGGGSSSGTESHWQGGLVGVPGFADGGLVGSDNNMLSDLQSGKLVQGTQAYAEYQKKRKAQLKKDNPDINRGGLIYTWDEEGEGYIIKPGQALQPGNGSGASSHVYAGGGSVKGPGTATSDSILARLSNGEFVVKAQAVQAYGASLFQALNNMTFPGFATGGLVGVPSRMGSSSPVQASRALNLTIDGQTFGGLRGPAHVIDSLASFAVARQSSATGRNPSWMK